jgi:hypothetical protein
MIIRLTNDIFVESTNILYTEASEVGGLDVWLNQHGDGATIVQVRPEEVGRALSALAQASASQLRAIQLIGDEANQAPVETIHG